MLDESRASRGAISNNGEGANSDSNGFSVSASKISLPKGGGAVHGIGEKFSANPVTGTASMSVPIATSPGRSGFGPQLSLSYDSGSGNSPFGFGWSLSLPSITRKTDRGLPKYQDATDSDVFILSGAEDLVPVLIKNGTGWTRENLPPRDVNGVVYHIRRYRPRSEGLFARIERWTRLSDGDIHWRSLSKDNHTMLYGATADSRIVDPSDSSHIFSWLVCESYDDKGNAIRHEYKAENSQEIDLSNVHERNRSATTRSANRYLKRIKYGNRTPRQAGEDLSLRTDWMFEVVFDYGEHDVILPAPGDDSVPGSSKPWPVRNDPFSSYRAGFEIRTYRLCRRVLMYHHFPGESEVGAGCLVRSTDLGYAHEQNPADARNPIYSFVLSVTASGYKRQPAPDAGYLKRSLPPVEFTYTEARIQADVREVDAASLQNLPAGLDGARYQWVDLEGEGLSGILTEEAGAWFYKRNLSPLNVVGQNGTAHVEARFAPVELVATKPGSSLDLRQAQFLDLAGDGQLDLVTLRGPTPGFYERTHHQGWGSFTTFDSLPALDWDDPNLRFVDLTGDGHADVLITENDVFNWHPSLAEKGFGPGETTRQARDEEKGPCLVFADGTQSIYLADMSGDGLTDLVRIRNGEVCYWPNLGYGRFGAKVAMDNSPWFDVPDHFEQNRVRLADIDGSGATDIIYLHGDGVRIYFNQSGNGWSQPPTGPAFPRIDSQTSVTVVDLLGNGTACLVWSSPLPGDSRQSMRYIDLMGGQKPHLLVKTVNNLGAETVVHYAPSTQFYLQDQYAGKPWITKLPFPVYVVERVETYDRLSRNRFVTRYAYHHGYFDGVEREFHGFGLVEQWDTGEFAALTGDGTLPQATNVDAASHVPPVHTKTWFHTGVYIDRNRVSNFFAGLLDVNDPGEYYRAPGLDDQQARALLLDDTMLPDGLSVEEEREACRALKGAMLRQEVYAQDGTTKAGIPYTVTEQNFTIEQPQPRAGNRHAVFFTHPREAISYHYERNATDPRIGHTLTLQVDEFGNVSRSLAVSYPRANVPERQPLQAETHLTVTLGRFANVADQQDWYRVGLPVEIRTAEIVKPPTAMGRFTYEELRDLVTALMPPDQHEPPLANTIPYEQWDWRSQWNPQTEPGGLLNGQSVHTRLRLIEHVRTLYRPDDLNGALPLGDVQSRALPFESYKLVFTPGLVTAIYGGRVTDAMLETEGRYVHSAGDANWWIPTGRMFYSPDSADLPAQELAHAHQHFFLPCRYRDPFHTPAVPTESFVTYDAYDLLMLETRDALGNRVTVGERDVAGDLTILGNDYRVLQPARVMDPNRNRTVVAFDALGLVVGAAVMGKPEENLGDSLTGFTTDLSDAVVLDHLTNPLATPQAILARASTRMVYDLFAYHRTRDQADPQPAVVYTMARETHDSDPIPVGGLKIQHSFSYSDGFGREMQKKIQAEPEKIGGVAGPPRWVGSGWTVFNNKGKPVRQYEPFFTDTHRFEFDVRIGVSPVLFYDPVERVVATLHPNHTWEKVVFDAWRQETWDANDTVLIADPKTDPDVGDFFARLPDADYLPSWHAQRQQNALGPGEQAAADKSAIHAATPAVAHVDSLERTFLTVAHNKFKYSNTPPLDPPIEEFHRTRVMLDIEGNQREVRDAIEQNGDQQGRIVMRYGYSMAGPEKAAANRVHQASMEAGERWMLNDVAGKPLYAWDSRNHRFRTAYDALRRPTDSFLQESAGAELLVGSAVYGETLLNPEASNARGKVVQLFDQAGAVTSDDYDFKGNLLRSHRQLAKAVGLIPAYKTSVDWSAAVQLETDLYTNRIRYDALNRPTELIAPDNSVIRPGYNEANLLERMDVNLHGAQQDGLPVWTPFITDIDYDAKGQRTQIDYGNGARTDYTYDLLTLRLVHLLTRRNATDFPDDFPESPPSDWPGFALQNLHYTYDPVGNITQIRDDAQQTIYYKKTRVEPSADYTYDAVYRLIEATGREHLGQTGVPTPHSYNDFPRVSVPHPSDGSAMGRYLERYVYDAVGNFLSMQHRGSDLADPAWTRAYAYHEASQIEPGKQSNRLTRTTTGDTVETYSAGGNGYDAHGSMLRMPHLQTMLWNFKDQLQMTQRQAVNASDDDGVLHHGERTWYVYDASGQRVRKVTELPSGQIKDERIYLGGFEAYRQHGLNPLVRETLHIADGQKRVALVETRTLGNDPAPQQLIRYQSGNHLGSASLEIDDQARIISYEEYTPYGSTSYQAVDGSIKAAARRYRYTGKERDDETGLTYHGTRYCAAWLGRWTSSDPIGLGDGVNLYVYGSNNPIIFIDPSGNQSTPAEDFPKNPVNNQTFKFKGSSWEFTYDATQKDWIAQGSSLPTVTVTNPDGFWKSFGKGLIIGLAIAIVAVAVVATAGAALAIIAPAAAGAIATSTTIAAIGTIGAEVGGAFLAANTIQSLRGRDLLNNRISEDEAGYSLGFGLGGALAGPLSKSLSKMGNRILSQIKFPPKSPPKTTSSMGSETLDDFATMGGSAGGAQTKALVPYNGRPFALWSGTGTEKQAIAGGYRVLGETRAARNLANLIDKHHLSQYESAFMWGRLSKTLAKSFSEGSIVPAYLNNPRATSVFEIEELPELIKNRIPYVNLFE